MLEHKIESNYIFHPENALLNLALKAPEYPTGKSTPPRENTLLRKGKGLLRRYARF